MDAYTSTEAPPEPPSGLSERGATFWTETLERYELRIPDELTVLHELCRTLGVIDVLAQTLADSQTLEQKGSMGQPVGHWAIAEMRVQRGLVAGLTKALALPDEELDEDEQARDAGARSRAARHAARARWSQRA